MEQLTQFMKSAEKWDRKYLKVATEAITALSPTELIRLTHDGLRGLTYIWRGLAKWIKTTENMNSSLQYLN